MWEGPGVTEHRHDDQQDQPVSSLVRHEERLRVGCEERDAGVVRIRTRVDTHPVSTVVDRDVEHAVTDRQPADENDSGEIEELEDGSLSIPVLEEQLVVTKRVVVRERIIVRKERRTEPSRVEEQLRRQHVEITRHPPDER